MHLLTRKEALREKAHRLNHQIDLIEEELKYLQELTAVEDELDELNILEPPTYPDPRMPPRTQRNATPTNHFDDFPEGTKVRFPLATTEKKHLRGKTGTVVGHSPKFVKVEREGQVHLGRPSPVALRLSTEHAI